MVDLFGEFLGTAILVVLGNGVVANVLLARTKGHDSGWIVITSGWAIAVFVAVICVEDLSGAHINPAVTLGLALADRFAWSALPGYVAAQMLGGIAGGAMVYALYRPHYAATDGPDFKLATFCTAPNIRDTSSNFLVEAFATFLLVFAVLQITAGEGAGSLGALPVALLVYGIGASLGGPTGYAINPARDLGPRIAHALLPIPGKRDSDWGYAWIPVVGPLLGAVSAAFVARLIA
jgi:glycerol uptake facilitator protein